MTKIVGKFQIDNINVKYSNMFWYISLVSETERLFLHSFVKKYYLEILSRDYPAGICLFKAVNGYIRAMCDFRSKLTTKTPEWRQQREKGHPGVFIVNFEQVVGWLWTHANWVLGNMESIICETKC